MARKSRIDAEFLQPPRVGPRWEPARPSRTAPLVGWMPPVFDDAVTYGEASARQAIDACRAAQREPIGVTPLVLTPPGFPRRSLSALHRGVESAWVALGVPVSAPVVEPGPLRLGYAVQARPRRRSPRRGARPGDGVHLSRALGVDVLLEAYRKGTRTAAQTRAWIRAETRVDDALAVRLAGAGPAVPLGAHGLAAAALELAEAWDLDVVLDGTRLPVLTGVTGHLLAGTRPASLDDNRGAVGARVSVARGVSEAAAQLAFGAEWTGGVLWVDDARQGPGIGVIRRKRARRPAVRLLPELDGTRSRP